MHAGNMWGLLERTVAVECLATVAGELKKSKADLQGLLPASEYSALETFFSRTVEAAGLHFSKQFLSNLRDRECW